MSKKIGFISYMFIILGMIAAAIVMKLIITSLHASAIPEAYKNLVYILVPITPFLLVLVIKIVWENGRSIFKKSVPYLAGGVVCGTAVTIFTTVSSSDLFMLPVWILSCLALNIVISSAGLIFAIQDFAKLSK